MAPTKALKASARPTDMTACEGKKLAPDHAEESCAFIRQAIAISVKPAVMISRASMYLSRYIASSPKMH
jgi:hypothetical protein